MNALVVGCGSIGSRHARNLTSLGVAVTAFDADRARAARVASETGAQEAPSLTAALERHPALVLVCTPPHLHAATARQALEAHCHLFVEKPISHSLEGVDDLLEAAAARGRILYVGYSLRFHAGLRRAKELIAAGAIGRPLIVRAEAGQYLPTWRPTQDYRSGYIVSHETGGGMILDGSHEIDYVRWFGGEINRVYCAAAHVSDLEMETEDSAAITLRFEHGGIGEIHLDCVQRGQAKNCKVVGDEGTVVWDYPRGLTTWIRADGSAQDFLDAQDPNAMYLEQIRHVLAVVRGDEAAAVDGQTGRRVLEIALAAKRSAQLGKEIDV